MNKIRFIQTSTFTDDQYLKMTPEFKILFLTLMLAPYTSLCGIFSINFAMLGLSLGLKEESAKTLFEAFTKQFPGIIAYDDETGEVAIINWTKIQMINFEQKAMKKAISELQDVQSTTLLKLVYKNSSATLGKEYLSRINQINMEKINKNKALEEIDKFNGDTSQTPENQEVTPKVKLNEMKGKVKEAPPPTQTNQNFETNSSLNTPKGKEGKVSPANKEHTKSFIDTIEKELGIKVQTGSGGVETSSERKINVLGASPSDDLPSNDPTPHSKIKVAPDRPYEPKVKPKNAVTVKEQEYKDRLKTLIIKKIRPKNIVETYLQDLETGVDEFLDSFVNYCWNSDVNFNNHFKGIPELMEIHAAILSKGDSVIPEKMVVSQYKPVNDYR